MESFGDYRFCGKDVLVAKDVNECNIRCKILSNLSGKSRREALVVQSSSAGQLYTRRNIHGILSTVTGVEEIVPIYIVGLTVYHRLGLFRSNRSTISRYSSIVYNEKIFKPIRSTSVFLTVQGTACLAAARITR